MRTFVLIGLLGLLLGACAPSSGGSSSGSGTVTINYARKFEGITIKGAGNFNQSYSIGAYQAQEFEVTLENPRALAQWTFNMTQGDGLLDLRLTTDTPYSNSKNFDWRNDGDNATKGVKIDNPTSTKAYAYVVNRTNRTLNYSVNITAAGR